jgi:hypothetical protein
MGRVSTHRLFTWLPRGVGAGRGEERATHIRVKGACTTPRDHAARATRSRVTLLQPSRHDSGVRLRALCRLRSYNWSSVSYATVCAYML